MEGWGFRLSGILECRLDLRVYGRFLNDWYFIRRFIFKDFSKPVILNHYTYYQQQLCYGRGRNRNLFVIHLKAAKEEVNELWGRGQLLCTFYCWFLWRYVQLVWYLCANYLIEVRLSNRIYCLPLIRYVVVTRYARKIPCACEHRHDYFHHFVSVSPQAGKKKRIKKKLNHFSGFLSVATELWPACVSSSGMMENQNHKFPN